MTLSEQIHETFLKSWLDNPKTKKEISQLKTAHSTEIERIEVELIGIAESKAEKARIAEGLLHEHVSEIDRLRKALRQAEIRLADLQGKSLAAHCRRAELDPKVEALKAKLVQLRQEQAEAALAN